MSNLKELMEYAVTEISNTWNNMNKYEKIEFYISCLMKEYNESADDDDYKYRLICEKYNKKYMDKILKEGK